MVEFNQKLIDKAKKAITDSREREQHKYDKYQSEGIWCNLDSYRQFFKKNYTYDTPFSIEEFNELLKINENWIADVIINQYLYDIDAETEIRSQLFDIIPNEWKQLISNKTGVALYLVEKNIQNSLAKPVINVPLAIFGCGDTYFYKQSQKEGKKIYG